MVLDIAIWLLCETPNSSADTGGPLQDKSREVPLVYTYDVSVKSPTNSDTTDPGLG